MKILNIILQNIPNRKDMAHRAAQHEEVENGMHVGAVVEGIEQGTGDVADSFADNPTHGMRADGIHQGFEGYQYDQSHQTIADSFQMTMFLELAETDTGSNNGAKPYKTEKCPSPITLFAKSHEGNG